MHLCQLSFSFKGINTYRNVKNSTIHYSETEFLISDPKKNTNIFLEYSDANEISYFIFENKVELYTKNGKATEYSRTTRVDKKERIPYRGKFCRGKFLSGKFFAVENFHHL